MKKGGLKIVGSSWLSSSRQHLQRLSWWVKPEHVEALHICAKGDAQRRGSVGFDASQHRVVQIEAFDLSAKGWQGFADGLDGEIR